MKYIVKVIYKCPVEAKTEDEAMDIVLDNKYCVHSNDCEIEVEEA